MLLCPLISNADSVALYLENDLIYDTDHYYTHGTKLTYYNDTNDWGVSIGQNMYTPTDKKATALVTNDHPYAGWLYAGFEKNFYRDNCVDFFELDIGVVGSWSMAHQTQDMIHKWVDSGLAQGWDNQIPNRLAGVLVYKRIYEERMENFAVLEAYPVIAIGNVYDYAGAGTKLSLGYNIPDKLREHTILVKGRNIARSFYLYGYTGVEGRMVGYNIFLDKEGVDIEQETWVGDWNTGIVAGMKYFELAFTWAYRSKEFEEQREPIRVGCATVTVKF